MERTLLGVRPMPHTTNNRMQSHSLSQIIINNNNHINKISIKVICKLQTTTKKELFVQFNFKSKMRKQNCVF